MEQPAVSLDTILRPLKKHLGWFHLSLRGLLTKLFNGYVNTLRKDQFARLAKFADRNVPLEAVDKLFMAVSSNGELSIDLLERGLADIDIIAEQLTTFKQIDAMVEHLVAQRDKTERTLETLRGENKSHSIQ